jgi:AcrR family transcriptional regulator
MTGNPPLVRRKPLTRRTTYAKPPAAATERGRRTRLALINAALDLMQTGRGYATLSIREVTKQAGIVPTAFYRHFKDMDELGLSMVDDCGKRLREQLSDIRHSGTSAKDIIRHSVTVFHQYVEAHPKYFLVLSGERYGGSAVIRAAIRSEIEQFIEDMAKDLHDYRLLPQLSMPMLRNVCDLCVSTMVSASTEFLDLHGREPELGRRVESYVRQLRIIFAGAFVWRERANG